MDAPRVYELFLEEVKGPWAMQVKSVKAVSTATDRRMERKPMYNSQTRNNAPTEVFTMANDKAKKRAAKKVEKAVRKAVKKGVTENAVEKAVSQGMAKAAPKKHVGKAAAAEDAKEAKAA
jgi:hypothetical protein